MLDYYLAQLASKKVQTAKNLNFPEKTMVLSHTVVFLYRCKNRIRKEEPSSDREFIYRFLSTWNNNKFNIELKKNDYYGLELLKKII